MSEAVTRRAHHGRAAVLQQVDGADRPGAAVPDRRRAAHRLAQGDGRRTCATSSLWPGAGGGVDDRASAWPPGLRRVAGAAVICFGFCAFTTTTIAQEFVARRRRSARRNTGSDAVSSLMGMVLRGKRRYGGYLVHVGIVLMFLGFAGTAYKKETRRRAASRASRGEDRQVHAPLRSPGPRGGSPEGDGHRRGHRLQGRQGDRPHAAGQAGSSTTTRASRPPRWPSAARRPRTSTSRSATTISPRGTSTLKLVVNPVVDWIWFGFMLLAIGTGIALLPEPLLERLTAARAGAGRRARRARPGWCCCWRWARALRCCCSARAARRQGRRRPRWRQADGGGARARGRRRELAGAQHHLPVRQLPAQPARVRVGDCGHAVAGPHRDPTAARPGQDPRRR